MCVVGPRAPPPPSNEAPRAGPPTSTARRPKSLKHMTLHMNFAHPVHHPFFWPWGHIRPGASNLFSGPPPPLIHTASKAPLPPELHWTAGRAQKWAEVLRHPCIHGGPQQRGTKSELAASTMPSQGPKSGRKCYVTPAFSGVPNKGEQNQNWLPQRSKILSVRVPSA